MWPVTPLHHLPLYCSLLLSNSHRIKPFYSFISLPFPSLSPKTHTHTHTQKYKTTEPLSLLSESHLSLFSASLLHFLSLIFPNPPKKNQFFNSPEGKNRNFFLPQSTHPLLSLYFSTHTSTPLHKAVTLGGIGIGDLDVPNQKHEIAVAACGAGTRRSRVCRRQHATELLGQHAPRASPRGPLQNRGLRGRVAAAEERCRLRRRLPQLETNHHRHCQNTRTLLQDHLPHFC